MSALLEDDWFSEACLFNTPQEDINTGKWLFLDRKFDWKNITRKNISKKIYRPSEYFKNNIWIISASQLHTLSDNNGILIDQQYIKYLPNIWHE